LVGAVWSQGQSNKQTEKILNLNEQITETITGGDSYPIAMPVYIAKHGEQGDIRKIILSHRGKYPIYDLTVIITDLIACEEEHKKEMPNQDIYMWKKQIGTIGKGYEEILLEIPATNSSLIDYRFAYIARNGQTIQRSIYTQKDNKWITGTRLEKNGKIIHEYLDKDFPISLFSEQAEAN